MLFNSYEFIFAFLPITFFLYYYLNMKHLTDASKALLVLSSLFFYSWWEIVYLPLILGSMLINYVAGRSLTTENDDKRVNKKRLLTISIIANVALLGFFKYSDFFITNLDIITGSHINLLHLTLPLAISFFTFQQIAYLVDSYRGKTNEYDLLDYALFVTFFPQLIAGPIVHHEEMMPQFANIRNKMMNYKNIALGLFIFSIGLFKKVVIADTFAVWATVGFDTAQSLALFEAWATSLSYTFQLYFDFSGYTDMAIGAALLFNIRLPINFNSPYKATNIQDFWRRWHMTLSRFLRDYVYVPLGGNRNGDLRTYSNLMATFMIGGLWHGAGWTFILWGTLHGFAIVLHRSWHSLGFRMNTLLAWFITFNFINFSWIFFRAKELDDAFKVLSGMFFGEIVLPSQLHFLIAYFNWTNIRYGNWMEAVGHYFETPLFLLFGLFLLLSTKNSNQLTIKANKRDVLFITLLLGSSLIYMNAHVSEFLYFNF